MRARLLLIVSVHLFLFCGCGSKIPISSRPPVPVSRQPVRNYQSLFDAIGDRCYAGDQFPRDIARREEAISPELANQGAAPPPHSFTEDAKYRLIPTTYRYSPDLTPQASTQAPGKKKKAISSVDDLSLLSDIEFARYKDGDLIVVGPAAKDGEGFRPDDWYTVFRSIAGNEAPGVSIDPGPDSRLMQVRYFGGIQQTALGNTFFEADRTLKLLSTGFDNTTCTVWTGRPRAVPTELDLISAEIGDGSRPMEGAGGWHRFWFEPNEEPVETEGSTMRIPRDRLIVKDESVPPGRPSPNSALQFASATSTNFLRMSQDIRAFRQLQQDAALVILAKWMRDKQIPADQDWTGRSPNREATAATTPSITVLRAKLLDQVYLQYGIHGGVDFQKDNRYGPASPQTLRLSSAVEQSADSGASTWQFGFDGKSYQAVRLSVLNPVQIAPRWVIWQRVITRVLAQPQTYRVVLPRSDLVVTNDTGAELALKISGPISKVEQISVGAPTTVRVVPGLYHLTITSKCGTSNDTVSVAEGDRHQLRYWCETRTANPQSSTGNGFFVVNNNTGESLTVSVGGLSYTVFPGSFTIRLTPGHYTATITSRCGTATEDLSVTDGSTYTGQYSCVVR